MKVILDLFSSMIFWTIGLSGILFFYVSQNLLQSKKKKLYSIQKRAQKTYYSRTMSLFRTWQNARTDRKLFLANHQYLHNPRLSLEYITLWQRELEAESNLNNVPSLLHTRFESLGEYEAETLRFQARDSTSEFD